MGLILEKKIRRKIEEGKRAVFTLSAYTYDFHPDNNEGCYTCNIRLFDINNHIVDEFYRHFLVSNYSDNHYKRFISKFCVDINYREQFNIKKDTVERRNNNEIDEEIVDIINRLNLMGLRTKYSCQGTKTPWKDRPHKSDGHSITAYITFQENLPKQFIVLARECDFIDVNTTTIQSKRREFNIHFPECVTRIIDKSESVRSNH
ncbi:hypothetical protein [Paenibacillus durus]|uniref:Uncharacterized protein n=1 Tax=Paenibacillus durus TaxID=44251 RepID=A0A089HVE0_PAEDU|nr:hypothetical protein [Paenibacillus durus]AIQ14318.1 hypothetical protein PDUR_22235 [Paenibacillus durus]